MCGQYTVAIIIILLLFNMYHVLGTLNVLAGDTENKILPLPLRSFQSNGRDKT